MTDITVAYSILTDESLTLFWKGRVFMVSSDTPNWQQMLKALSEERYDDLTDLIDQAQAVAKYVAASSAATKSGVEVIDGQVLWNGETMHGALVDRIVAMKAGGFDIAPMLAFLENLQANPSYRAREQLYGFLEANQLPITPDGCFMGYKRVKGDWKDCHTSSIDNSVGQVVSMPRDKVDDDPTRTCSAGLHVAGLGYLRHFHGERLLGVKVNPADVVAVPTDYQNTKMRVCRYEVLQELDKTLVDGSKDAWNTPVVRDDGTDWRDDDEVEEDEEIEGWVLEHRDEESWFTGPMSGMSEDLHDAEVYDTENEAATAARVFGIEGEVCVRSRDEVVAAYGYSPADFV